MSLPDSTENASAPSSTIREKSLSEYLTAKSDLWHVWNWDVAQRMKIRRKAIAKEAGLEDSWDVGSAVPQIYTDPPGGGVIERTLVRETGGGFVTGALTAVSAGAIVAAGMYGLLRPAPTPPNVDPEVITNTITEEFDIRPRVVE